MILGTDKGDAGLQRRGRSRSRPNQVLLRERRDGTGKEEHPDPGHLRSSFALNLEEEEENGDVMGVMNMEEEWEHLGSGSEFCWQQPQSFHPDPFTMLIIPPY